MKILTLFLTYGISLEDWDKTGTLEREANVYGKLLKYFDKIFFITYGKNDLKYAQKLPSGIVILPKKIGIGNFLYSFVVPLLYRKELKESNWLKTNQMLGSWSAVLTKIFFRKKLAVRTGFTESSSFIGKNYLKRKVVEIMEYIAYKFADVSIVTSDFQKDYISRKYRIKNIFVIQNGINIHAFKPSEEKIHSGKKQLLFVGRLHPEKNIENLLLAIKDIPNVKLTMIGQGELEKYVLTFKTKNNLDLEIIPKIYNSELAKFYNKADIYIQPSIYEGNPKTILEAMSCGLPVIGSDVTGINNIIKNGYTGCLCKVDDKSIKDAIINLVGDYRLSKEMGKNARKFIEDNYDLDKIIEKEIDLYKANE